MPAAIVLFTRDLRLADNPAFSAAVRDFDQVLPLFVFDPRLLAGGHSSPNRLAFLLDCLADLDRSLGGGLITRTGDPAAEALRLAAQAGATTIEVARDASAYARRRVARLEADGSATGVRIRTHPGPAVVEPGAVLPAERDHFALFTPYHRRWLATPIRALEPRPAVPPPAARFDSCAWPDRPRDLSPNLPAGGESAGRQRLDRWLSTGLAGHPPAAADLGADATSRLSPYLHFGCVSAVEAAHRSQAEGGAGGQAFVRQLCWRDFHLQVLDARPDLATVDYRPRGARWQHDPSGLEQWKAGRTGFPLVDAAMRQLQSEGWMPNRARLVAASFLVKDLSIDWRLGLEHFGRWLVDGDLASNAGNWQWVAGTGNDPRPNRVLNPERQAARFDPTGAYVRRHLPEFGTADYPSAMVDHRQAAARFQDARRPEVQPSRRRAPRLRPGPAPGPQL